MAKVDFFSAFTIALILSIGSFAYQAIQASPEWMVAFERSFFQSFAVFFAWLMWRTPGEKVQRRGQGPGYCD